MQILVLDYFSLWIQQVGRDFSLQTEWLESKMSWTGPIFKLSNILHKPLGLKAAFMCSKMQSNVVK